MAEFGSKWLNFGLKMQNFHVAPLPEKIVQLAENGKDNHQENVLFSWLG